MPPLDDSSVPSPAVAKPDSRCVLVVEDIETTRQRVAQALRRDGYEVVEAADGLEALKQASERRFDAILLDLVMPNMDGWQFRETQLRHPELASVPTVIVTVQPLREHDRYALRARDVIRKPFEDADLLAMVTRACTQPQKFSPRSRPPSGPTTPAPTLFWSRRGEIACASHAPGGDSQRWSAESWSPLPAGAGKGRVRYQCQHCPGHAGPIGRASRD
jgi:two-component system response regulator MprA